MGNASLRSQGPRAACSCLLLAAALVAPATGGCAGEPAAFSTRYPDNRDNDVELLLQRINAAAPHRPGTVAAGVGSDGKLYGFDLSSRKTLWQQPIKASSPPHLAGDVVVVQTADAVVGFDLRSGVRRFSVARGQMSLKGAGGAGPLVAFVIGQGQGTFAKSQALLVRGGALLWRRPLGAMAGVPAVVGSMVLVPWSSQYLSAIDVESGDEIARVRVRDGVIGHVLDADGQVYVGSYHGIARVTSSIGSGKLRGAGYFSLPEHELPGRPKLLSDVYTMVSAPAPDSAQHRIALAWQPKPLDNVRLGLLDDNLYLVFYRFVFALSPRDYAVRWVYVHDDDIVGEQAQPGGLVVADEQGRFAFLGAPSGKLLWQADSGLPSMVVRLPESGAGPGGGGPALDPNALAVQLMAAAQDQDARMVPARMLAVMQLARLPQAEVTADLIELCDSSRLAPAVQVRACTELKHRSVGAEHLLAALQRHAGYLEGTTSPPVGWLAKAVASLKEKQAVGPLIAQLKDPGTRSSDLPPLVKALGDLGDPAAAEPLADFLRLYHADAVDEHVLRALELAPQVLVKLSGPVAQPVLEAITYDELGVYSVRQKAKAALDVLAAQQAAAEKKDEAAQQAQAEQVAQEVDTAADPSKYAPLNLTLGLVDQTLLPVHDQLIACLANAKKPTFQARVLLVVEDGKLLMVSVLPSELQGCVEPLIRSQTFPKTKSAKRDQISYTIKR